MTALAPVAVLFGAVAVFAVIFFGFGKERR
jgi:hypothetical protein